MAWRTSQDQNADLFQFHYGSIKIQFGCNERHALRVFQFHYGSIKIYNQIFAVQDDQVSIPLWFD